MVEELTMQLNSVRELYYNERASQMALSNLVREVKELREPHDINRRINSLRVRDVSVCSCALLVHRALTGPLRPSGRIWRCGGAGA